MTESLEGRHTAMEASYFGRRGFNNQRNARRGLQSSICIRQSSILTASNLTSSSLTRRTASRRSGVASTTSDLY